MKIISEIIDPRVVVHFHNGGSKLESIEVHGPLTEAQASSLQKSIKRADPTATVVVRRLLT